MTVTQSEYRVLQVEDFFVTRQASDIIDKLWSLKRLGIPACWVFEGDDGLEHYETCESLLDYLADFGGRLIRLGSRWDDIEAIHKGSISSGKFLIQLD